MEIVLSCPQCGAEVALNEDASVFRCRYCDSTLKPTGRNEVESFFFPPKGTVTRVAKALADALGKQGRRIRVIGGQILYAPYWRVKGQVFQWVFGRKYEPGQAGASSFDDFKRARASPYHRTFPAFNSARWQVISLGLRVQVVKMYPYNREKMDPEAVVLKQEVPLGDAVKRALQVPTQTLTGQRERIELIKTQLIGETYSLLYFPFHCVSVAEGSRERLVVVDGLSHKVLEGQASLQEVNRETRDFHLPSRPMDFIPFKCPNCGWDFPYRPFSRIHLCRTCARAWEERGGKYQEVAFTVTTGKGAVKASDPYLPFWKLTLVIEASGRTYGDLKTFYELLPQTRVQAPETLANRPILFYVPAFRIRNPVAVERFAARFTRTQPVISESAPPADFQSIKAADVWLPASEAAEMAEVILLGMIPKRARRTLAVLKGAELHLKRHGLLWMRFREEGIFLRETVTDCAIQKNCVEID
jgi:ribosomal protein L37AE/L43A